MLPTSKPWLSVSRSRPGEEYLSQLPSAIYKNLSRETSLATAQFSVAHAASFCYPPVGEMLQLKNMHCLSIA